MAAVLLIGSYCLTASAWSKDIGDNHKGLYMSAEISQSSNPRTDAGRTRSKIINLLETTEMNAAVIDVLVDKPLFTSGLKELINQLKSKGIYRIARIQVAQNNHFAKLHPEAVLIKRSTGQPWTNMGSKGINPASPELIDYLVEMSNEAIDIGFNEIQYDYIRFPADHNCRDIIFPNLHGRSRREVMKNLFKLLTDRVRAYQPNIVLSVDIFGMAVIKGYAEKANQENGQYFEDAVNYFDVISPMVYPTYWQSGSWGMPVPGQQPYRVINNSLKYLVNYLQTQQARARVRPWLQYFSGVNRGTKTFVECDAQMITEQRRALTDLGLSGFLYWNPGNIYDRGAIVKNKTTN